MAPARAPTILELPGGSIDLRTGWGVRGEREFHLTRTELDLLRYLVRQPDVDVGKEELLHAVWGYHERVLSRAVDTAVRRLRAKLGQDGSGPELIQTTRGRGYRFRKYLEGRRTPRVPPRLWGREALVGRILAALSEGAVCLIGPPGVGKTALAATVARRLGRPSVWVDARGHDTAAALLGAVSAAFRLADPSEVAETLARWMEPTLLVLDGTDDLRDADWPEIVGFDTRNIQVLITRAAAPPTTVAPVLTVPPLTPDDALSMFAARSAAPDPASLDPALVRSLLELVGHLPLGIEVAGAALRRSDLRTLVARLANEVPAPLHGALVAGIERLGAEALRTLVHLSVFGGRSFDPGVARTVLGVDRAVIEELIDASLLTVDDLTGRCQMLRPVVALLASQWQGSALREQVIRAHRSHFAAMARDLGSAVPSAADVGALIDDLRFAAQSGPRDDEFAILVVWLHRAWVAGLTEPTWILIDGAPEASPAARVQVLACAAELVGLRDSYRAACEVQARARDIAIAHGLDTEALQMRVEWCLMAMGVEAGPGVAEALAECRQDLDRHPDGPRARRVDVSLRLAEGRFHQHCGRMGEARAALAGVCRDAAELEDLVTASSAAELLAAIEASEGRLGSAARWMTDAVDLAERGRARIPALIRRVQRASWLVPDVGRAGQTALELAELENEALRAGLIGVYASARLSRGVLALNDGDHALAAELLRDAQELARAGGRARSAADAEGSLGLVHHDRGRRIEAIGHYQRATGADSAGFWAVLLAIATSGPRAVQPGPGPTDRRVTALIRACADPDPHRDEEFRTLQWWPTLDRILRRMREV